MTASHEAGPSISFGIAAGNGQSNPQAGPSVTYQGDAVLDPRVPYAPGIGDKSIHVWSHLDTPYLLLVDYVPATKGTALIAALQNVTNGTAMTLTAGTGVTSGISIQSPIWNTSSAATVSGLFALDGAYAPLTVGVINQMFDPTKSLTRAVSVTGSASATGGNILIKGYDLYGVPMSELIAAPASATTVNGKKAFKYIASATPQFTDAHNYSIGTTDIIGINVRSTKWEYTNFYVNGAFISASTGYTAAVQTSPATTTTGDVRGTYALQTASDGSTVRVAMFMSLQLSDLTSATPSNYVSLYGVTQA